MIQGEYVPNTLFGLERVWNRYGAGMERTPSQHHFQVLHLMVWNRGVWNRIRGLDLELWIGVWIGMCARACSAPFILSASHIYIYPSLSYFKSRALKKDPKIPEDLNTWKMSLKTLYKPYITPISPYITL